jgi:hypothetical protein
LKDSPFDYGSGVEIQQRLPDRKKAAPSGESRRHPRCECNIPALVASGNRRLWGRIRNASRGGVFIQCSSSLATGQKVSLTIPLEKKKKLTTRVDEIVWADGDGIGIIFMSEGGGG